MKNPIAFRILFFSFLIFLYYFFVGKIYADSEQFFSDNTWGVYSSDPFSNPQAVLFGNAEEINWPGPNSYPGILPEAKWIWAPGIVDSTNPVDLTEYYFSKSFIISNFSTIESGNIVIVVDDLADIFINGSLSGSHGSITNVELSGNTPRIIDITSFLRMGKNVITIRAQNGPSSFSAFSCSHCAWNQNPVGLIFSGLLDWNLYAKELTVPLLKQTSIPWKSQIYDSANKWTTTNPTINYWGCALTSATMVLNYHGINKLPNGAILDPGTLNSWLKSQKDGYIGTGWVNWLALSRLSKLAKLINNITTFDALQYSRTNSSDKTQLINDINNSQPDILEEPGHFVVAKGINGTTFNINDPYYNRNTLNDGYLNTFLTLGRYIPSYTNLSYIMLSTDPEVNITLRDSENHIVGESFIQQPLVSDDNPTQSNSPIQIFYLPQPQTQYYYLTISSSTDKIYNLHAYLYDQDGNVNVLDQNGLIGTGKTDNFTIDFDQQNFGNSKNTKIVTFQSLIDDVNEAKTLKFINNNGVYDSLLTKGTISQIINLINKKTSLNILNSLLNELNAQRGKHVSEDAYQILLYDVNYLKTHL